MSKIKWNTGFAVLLIVAAGLACGLGEQTDEANKLVGEANAIITQNNERIIKSGTLFTDLMGDNVAKATDLAKYKTENKAKFDELISLSGQIEKSGEEIIGKFEKAASLKLDEKYKEYLNLKAQELKKRAEADKLTVPFVKTFLETKDVDEMDKQIQEFNTKNAALVKESDELKAKADQIVKDNPNKIK